MCSFVSSMVVATSTFSDDHEKIYGPTPPVRYFILSALTWPFTIAAIAAASRKEKP